MRRRLWHGRCASHLCIFACCPGSAQDTCRYRNRLPYRKRFGVSEYLNKTVELVLPGKEDFYSKSVAETILKDFFTRYRSREFVIKHQGARGDAQYAIANLKPIRASSGFISC